MIHSAKNILSSLRRTGTLAGLVLLPLWQSSTVLLTWEPNPEEDLAGYRIYYGTESGQYDHSVRIGNVTEYRIADLIAGRKYYFVLTAIDAADNESAFSEEVVAEVAASEQSTSTFDGEVYNFPNPFRVGDEVTAIRYVLADASEVTIEVFDLERNLVKTVVKDLPQNAGEHLKDFWDGTNLRGEFVANGIYFCRIKTSEDERFLKIAVIR